MSAKPNISVPAARSEAHPLRAISFGDPAVTVERRDDGTIYLRPKIPLGEYPLRLTDRLHHWARAEPDRVFMAERAGGGWRHISYAQLLESSRRIASA
jgi:feruloyl-CoA synthase